MWHDTLHPGDLALLQGMVSSLVGVGCTVGGHVGDPMLWLLGSGVVEGICTVVGCKGSVSELGVEQIAVL